MSRKNRLFVVTPKGRIPFLRGILTRSLMKQGLTFEQSYTVARKIRARLAGSEEVSTERLNKLSEQIIVREFGAKVLKKLERESKGPEFGGSPPQILLENSSMPFSRGLLSQKLAGTGLDPQQAYETAQEVWNELLRRRVQQIPEAQLEELTRQTLTRKHGDVCAQRLDAVERIARSDRPLIVLIGGATGCGKSTLATEIAYRLGIRKIASTDMIREIMRQLLSPEILPSIHSSSYSYQAPYSNQQPIIHGFREQVQRVEVGLTASMRRAVVENFHLIVEGVHVLPPLAAAQEFEDQAFILPVIVATLDRSMLEARFRRRQKHNRRRGAERALQSIENILAIQEHILEQADQYDVPILENRNFDEAANDLLSLLTDALNRMVKKRNESA